MEKIFYNLYLKIKTCMNEFLNFLNSFSNNNFNYEYQDDEITLKYEW